MQFLRILALLALTLPMAWGQVAISALPDAANANATDQIPANQGGTTRRITVAEITTLIQNTFDASAELAAIMDDETGSGALVFALSPALVTPDLGTPSTLVLTNATGLPEAQVTAHEAALAIAHTQLTTTCMDDEILKAASGVFGCAADETGGAGGAPTDATYITQTADGTLSAEQALSSLSTGIMRVATTTGVITSLTDSAGIAANISDETGTGALTFATSPAFTTNIRLPDGSASAPGLAFTSGTTSGIWRIGSANLGLALGGVSMVEYGGGQTVRVWDQTAATGVSTLVVRAGAGQSTTALLDIRNSAGTSQLRVISGPTIENSVGAMGIRGTLTATGVGGQGSSLCLGANDGCASVSGARVFTAGVGAAVEIPQRYNPTSGTGVFSSLVLTPTINQTGGASGITRGLYVNPTLTAAADWRAIEVADGGGVIKSAGYVQASLPATAPNGSQVFCSDCLQGTLVCAGAGTGTMAFRLNGAWACF